MSYERLHNQQQQHQHASPPLLQELAPQSSSSMYLPAHWTPTDQVIMEDLLLSHDASAPLAMTTAAAASHCTLATAPMLSVNVDHHQQHARTNDTRLALPQWINRSRSGSTSSSPSSCSGSSARSPAPPSTFKADEQPSLSSSRRATKVSDEERRARHRAVQKRFVQRKKEAIRQTKQLAADLERQYALLHVTSEARELARENEELEAQCVATEALAAATILASAPEPLAILHEQMELVREFYEPLSHDAWTAMLQKNLDEYDAARRDQSYRSSGLTVMGWHDQRKIDDTSVKFVLSKEFVNVRAADLIEKTWRQLSSPETHAQFFSPVLTVRVQVLEVLNDDARVLHRALYNPQTGGIVHGIELLCRVRRGDEFIIFESAIERNAVHAWLGASHKWSQVTVSQVFAPTVGPNGVESCVYRHGGWLRYVTVSTIKYWLMEMFFMALRYESGMVAPIFTLTAE